MRAQGQGRGWSRDELLVVCGLYFSLPFGQMHARNPRVQEMARLLGRSAGSVAMKLVNLASLDPAHQQRGVKGLRGASQADATMWREFEENWAAMVVRSEEKREELEGLTAGLETQPAIEATEGLRFRKVRLMQAFFRRSVLAAYGAACCMTGTTVEELLVASHILPWARFPDRRVDPRNGLCLAAHYDRAFDRGLITFDGELRLTLSAELRRCRGDGFIAQEFVRREGMPMRVPERFAPDREYLAYHRASVFR